MRIGGVMSGTSCDGVSAAVLEVPRAPGRPRLLGAAHLAYPHRVRGLLLRLATGDPAPARDFARAGEEIARFTVSGLRAAARRAGLAPARLAAVGVHGHTLYHGPRDPGGPVTWQAANWSRIAAELGVTVVGDFRPRDVAAGGQGAPLAPWAHWRLFTHPREPRLVLNLGGIANVTWLPARARPGAVRAFDTGPANMVLDLLAARASGGRSRLDRDGRLAARGRVHPGVLARLLRHPYFRRRPPKSTGREMFGAALLPAFRTLRPADALATATAFTARSVAAQVGRWLPPAARRATVFVGGGGTRNPALMRSLRGALAPRTIHPVTVLGFPPDTLEAACFALLAEARLRGAPNVLPAVTGARHAVCAGMIVPAR